MPDETLGLIERRPTTNDLSWFLDLDKNGQLDLDPSYQRRSVWTPSDRRYFLDTIFRNYPSPAIFLHKSIADDGDVTYHVVDGKQRLSTVIMFVNNRIALPLDFGDDRLNGKKWRDLDTGLRRIFWNYPFSVEQIEALQGPLIKDVFARLNKNSRKLTRQELRHARFDGWFITFLESEVQDDLWRTLKVRTAAKEKRMVDVQNLSELCQVLLAGEVIGFDQFALDELYAELEEADSEESEFDIEKFFADFNKVKGAMEVMEAIDAVVSGAAQPFIHLYSLWSLLALENVTEDEAVTLAPKYAEFMARVATYELASELTDPVTLAVSDEVSEDERDENSAAEVDDAPLEALIAASVSLEDRAVARYKLASVGATTEPPQRRARYEALRSLLER